MSDVTMEMHHNYEDIGFLLNHTVKLLLLLPLNL